MTAGKMADLKAFLGSVIRFTDPAQRSLYPARPGPRPIPARPFETRRDHDNDHSHGNIIRHHHADESGGAAAADNADPRGTAGAYPQGYRLVRQFPDGTEPPRSLTVSVAVNTGDENPGFLPWWKHFLKPSKCKSVAFHLVRLPILA